MNHMSNLSQYYIEKNHLANTRHHNQQELCCFMPLYIKVIWYIKIDKLHSSLLKQEWTEESP